MSQAVSNHGSDHALSLDLALVVVCAVLLDGLSARLFFGTDPTGSVYLALFLHIALSLYIGDVRGRRRLTWLVLIGVWLLIETAWFLGYVLPWGQVAFWLSTVPVVGPLLSLLPDWDVAFAVGTLVPALILDVLAMQWRKRSVRRLSLLAIIALSVVVLIGLVATALELRLAPAPVDPALGLLTPQALVPDWHRLPFYAMLRAVPDPGAGGAMVFVALALPALGPWMAAERLRTGPTLWPWRVACVGLVGVWIDLGWLGAAEPTPEVLLWIRLLMVYYIAFFTVIPFTLHLVRRKWHGGGGSD